MKRDSSFENAGRPAKVVRFSLSPQREDAARAANAAAQANDAAAEASPCDANRAIELDFELVGGARSCAPPTYTHQFFEDEEVHGYAGLRATLSFACNLTHSFLHVQWDARLAGADDIAAAKRLCGIPRNDLGCNR